MFTHSKCLYTNIQRVAQLYCPLQDMDNVQNAVNPLSGRSTHYIHTMSTIQRIHSLVYQGTISKVQQIYPDTVSSSLQQEYIYTISFPYSQKILSSFVVRCTALIYTQLWKLLESYRTNLKVIPVTRSNEEILETSLNGFPQIY